MPGCSASVDDTNTLQEPDIPIFLSNSVENVLLSVLPYQGYIVTSQLLPAREID